MTANKKGVYTLSPVPIVALIHFVSIPFQGHFIFDFNLSIEKVIKNHNSFKSNKLSNGTGLALYMTKVSKQILMGCREATK